MSRFVYLWYDKKRCMFYNWICHSAQHKNKNGGITSWPQTYGRGYPKNEQTKTPKKRD